MIEARIVSATIALVKKLAFVGASYQMARRITVAYWSVVVIRPWQILKDFDIETTTVNGQTVSYPSYDISRPDNLNVDLGVSNPAGSIAFGCLSMSDVMLDLELSALQADNRGEVISTPKILTADKQTAKVSSGTQIPYQEASASGATTTSFKEAALSLEATPNITPDGKIGLQLLLPMAHRPLSIIRLPSLKTLFQPTSLLKMVKPLYWVASLKTVPIMGSIKCLS